jgi:hypothetical protein
MTTRVGHGAWDDPEDLKIPSGVCGLVLHRTDSKMDWVCCGNAIRVMARIGYCLSDEVNFASNGSR